MRAKSASGSSTVRRPVRPGSRAVSRPGPGPAAESSESRWRRIAEAAYYIAEQEGFPPGRELEHWLRAEAAIDRLLAARSPDRSAGKAS